LSKVLIDNVHRYLIDHNYSILFYDYDFTALASHTVSETLTIYAVRNNGLLQRWAAAWLFSSAFSSIPSTISVYFYGLPRFCIETTVFCNPRNFLFCSGN